ncbi:MAG TPA: amino acid racemase [Actinotalea sp.]|nr:amino acid racemase [Actinotalea sp.]
MPAAAFLVRRRGGRLRSVRTIGLLGGMSWESSIEYERMLNEGVRERLGGTASADLIVRSYDFAAIEDLQARGDWAAAADLLASDARRLEAAGADLVLLCTNTMHRVADAIEAAITVPFVHLADATALAVSAAGIRRVALLGTQYTMEQDFYRGRLETRGLEVLVPTEPDRTTVHDVIYDELVRGVVSPVSRSAYLDVIRRTRAPRE